MAAPPPAPQAPTSWWLSLASRLGRVAIVCLIVENFLLLFAPLAFLVGPSSGSARVSVLGSLLLVFQDAGFLVNLADLFAVIGFAILAPVLFLVLFGLFKSKRRVPFDTLLLGGALACVVAAIPVKLYAEARGAGSVTTIDAVAATGGWSVASGLVLAASILYFLFTLRIEAGTKPLKLSCIKWPIYAGVSVIGSVAFAVFFQGLAAGDPNFDAFTLGIVVKTTLVPVLGVLAYRDLLDVFPNWGRLPIEGAPQPIASAPAAVPQVAPLEIVTMQPARAPTRILAPLRPLPPPPAPANEMRRLPPPPTD